MLDVFGGPGVVHVFVHSTASLGHMPGLEESEAELNFEAERALLLARPDDVVCVTEPVEPEYLEFLASLGLGPRTGRIVVAGTENPTDAALAAIRDLVGAASRVVLNPFIASPREFQFGDALAKTLDRPVHVLGGNPDLIARANLKHVARAKAIELGVPVAPGEIVELDAARDVTQLHDALARQVRPTGRAIVRGSHGVSGSATFVVEDNPDSIRAALREVAGRTDNTVYLVEVMFDSVVSPNVLMHVEPDNGRVRCVGVSDQRLDGNLAHTGNVYPTFAVTAAEMIAVAHKLARWLQSEGFTGLAGFDFVEHDDPRTGRREQFLAEINARTNGAAYPKCVMDRLNDTQARQGRPRIGSFLAVKGPHAQARSFAGLRQQCGRLFFDPRTGRGMLPYNTGSLSVGKFKVAFFGATRKEVMGLREAYRRSLRQDGAGV